jgi:hypothetical protein
LVRKVAEFLEKELSEAQVTSLTSHLDFNAMRNNPATNRASTCILRGREYWMIYRGPGILAPPPPSVSSTFDTHED